MISIGGQNRFQVDENPLRRTGLILAGGNLAWKGMELPYGVEDGILAAFEVANMDLRKTKLVILSACDSSLGDIKAGEGVFGLQRAFRLAGVKTIIMSLWNVPDETTADLMSRFFQYWTGSEERSVAFNHAIKDLRFLYPDYPELWAAFVLVG
jgi:CHAT domain-containing protein